MYTKFYNLSGNPFHMTPDPSFYFETEVHRRAVAYLMFGLKQAEGFIVITGDVGAGKTTLLAHLLQILDPKAYVAAKIVSSHLQGDDMLRAVANGFNIDSQKLDKAALLNRIENFLTSNFHSGRRMLLLVDEAQNIPPAALEELRMLSNFQVGARAPLQGILTAQPQFRRLLSNPDLEQFRQRIVASHHLGPIGQEETREYIRHRLSVVGWRNNPEIDDNAFLKIYEHTSGVPRKINMFCARLMIYAYLDELRRIDGEAVQAVAEDMEREIGQSIETTSQYISAGVMNAPFFNAAPKTLEDASLEQRLTILEQTVARHNRVLSSFSKLVEQLLHDGDGVD
ncbi:general secretion pathway protein A [Azospirillaceae bacterium]